MYAGLLGLSSIVLAQIFAAVAAPIDIRADVTLDAAAVAEAQPRDNTATRAFTATSIKTSDGQCLSVDPLSGDFRENLTPITTAACDGTANQQWDIITAGAHNNEPGFMLVTSTLTNACLNFDPRRAAGNQVLLFSCGGRADGGGTVTNSQLFTFNGGSGPLPLIPQNGNNATCLTVTNGALDQTACDATQTSGAELFTFGGSETPAAGANNANVGVSSAAGAASTSASSSTSSSAVAATTTSSAAVLAVATSSAAASSTSAASAAVTPSITTGVTLVASAVAEAQPRDNTATRAFTATSIKTSDGQCLSVDPTSGDFRENLTPVTAASCDGTANQQWDIITAGAHNNEPGFMLVTSTLTNACLNFDPRRAAGNQVLLFSCGGRADGGGSVTNSQLFTFNGGQGPLPLVPQNGNNATCLTVTGGVLDDTSCDATTASGTELFTFGGSETPAAGANNANVQ